MVTAKSALNWLLTVQLCLLSPLVAANESAQGLLKLASEYTQDHRFRDAVVALEFARALDPKLAGQSDILERLLSAALSTQDYVFSLSVSRNLSEKIIGNDQKCMSIYYVGKSLYALKNYEDASKTFAAAGRNCMSSKDQLTYWNALAEARLMNFTLAGRHFENIVREPYKTSGKANAALLKKALDVPQKSPVNAGILSSLVPGLGYAYAGAPQTAIACFITTGLFGFATYAAVKNGNEGVAAPLALLTFGWHGGGVYGSASTATRYNRLQWEKYYEHLEELP